MTGFLLEALDKVCTKEGWKPLLTRMGYKRGEKKDGTVVKHCDIRIASTWNYCPICGKKKEKTVINWS